MEEQINQNFNNLLHEIMNVDLKQLIDYINTTLISKKNKTSDEINLDEYMGENEEYECSLNNNVNKNKKRKINLFLSNNKIQIKDDLNNNFILTNRNSCKSKIKYRLKSSKINNRTVHNNLNTYKNELPIFNISLKKKPNDEEEFDDIYTPKYPRPATLSGRREIKTPSNSLNMGYYKNNDYNENNSFNFFNLGILNKKKFQTIIPKNY